MNDDDFEEAIASMIFDGWTDAQIMELVARIRAQMADALKIRKAPAA
jgi:hypothetical protein